MFITILWGSFSVGTLLDGEPIISLPPKSVELKKVEYLEEKQDFYSRLEADSQAQFQVCPVHTFAMVLKDSDENICL